MAQLLILAVATCKLRHDDFITLFPLDIETSKQNIDVYEEATWPLSLRTK